MCFCDTFGCPNCFALIPFNTYNSLNFFMQTFKLRKYSWVKILSLLSGSIIVLTIVGFLARFWWAFELTSHFRVQYFVLLALFAALFAFGKKWKHVFVTAFFALVNFYLIVPYYSTKVVQASQSTLRSLSMNLDFRNSSYDKVASLIAKTQPDLLVLEEFTEEWEKALKNTLSTFPYSSRFSYTSPSLPYWLDNLLALLAPDSIYSKEAPSLELSIGLFSHLPIEEFKTNQLETYPIPHVKAKLKYKGKDFILFGVHLISPVTKIRSEIRNKQLLALGNIIKDLDQPTVLLGDLNSTPWSPHFKDFIQMAGLKEPRKGLGLYPTWPSWFIPIRIPIDHILVSNEITIKSFSLAHEIGSDHLPMLIDFSIG